MHQQQPQQQGPPRFQNQQWGPPRMNGPRPGGPGGPGGPPGPMHRPQMVGIFTYCLQIEYNIN